MKDISISIHCWQGDDVSGFEGGQLTGGIQATGNYPGRREMRTNSGRILKRYCPLCPAIIRLTFMRFMRKRTVKG